MLSRVAHSIYWLRRYIERADNIARFIDVNLHLNLDLPGELRGLWEPVIHSSGDYNLFVERYGEANESSVIQFLTFDTAYPNSILSCLHAARENARQVRDAISSEMWEQINTMYLDVKRHADHKGDDVTPHDLFTEIKAACHLFVGLSHVTMSHNEGWHFGRIGCLLERAEKTSRLLDVKYFTILPALTDIDTPYDNLQWSALLRSVSALEMYRKRWGMIYHRNVARYLILDREFPRAVHYCLTNAETSMHKISGTAWGMYSNPGEKAIGRLRSELDYTHIDDIIGDGLHEFLGHIQAQLNEIDDSIFNTFFNLRPSAS